MSRKIRHAESKDAAAVCKVIRLSIEKLCVPDHAGNPDILEPWLENKTPDVVAGWIVGNPKGYLVCDVDEQVAAVGAYTAEGDILLNYVHPDYRFQGISKKSSPRWNRKCLGPGL